MLRMPVSRGYVVILVLTGRALSWGLLPAMNLN